MSPRTYDIANVLGLGCVGVGTYLVYGVGVALITVGTAVVSLTIIGTLLFGRG